MLDAVKEFITDVKTHLTEGMTLDKHVLYLNENHIDWWLANCRETYGKDLDFTGPDGYKNRVPDSTIQIKEVLASEMCQNPLPPSISAPMTVAGRLVKICWNS